MPESRVRKSAEEKKKQRQAAQAKPKKIKPPSSRRWVPPTFITVGLLGVAWLITYYVAGIVHPLHERPGELEHPDRHGGHGRRLRHRHPLEVVAAQACRFRREALLYRPSHYFGRRNHITVIHPHCG